MTVKAILTGLVVTIGLASAVPASAQYYYPPQAYVPPDKAARNYEKLRRKQAEFYAKQGYYAPPRPQYRPQPQYRPAPQYRQAPPQRGYYRQAPPQAYYYEQPRYVQPAPQRRVVPRGYQEPQPWVDNRGGTHYVHPDTGYRFYTPPPGINPN